MGRAESESRDDGILSSTHLKSSSSVLGLFVSFGDELRGPRILTPYALKRHFIKFWEKLPRIFSS